MLDEIIPQMLRLYEDAQAISSRSHVISALTSIMEAQLHVSWDPAGKQEKISNHPSPIGGYKDTMLSLFISGMREDPVKEASLEALHQLILLRILNMEDYRVIADNLTKILVQACLVEDELAFEILSVLDALTKVSPILIEETTLPALFEMLPEIPPSKSDKARQVACVNALGALESLCIQPDLFSRLVIHFCTRIEFLIGARYDEASNKDNIEAAIAFVHALLKTLHHNFDKKLDNGDQDTVKYVERFLPRLYGLFFDAALANSGSFSIGQDPRLIAKVAEMVPVVISSLRVE